MKRSCSSPPLLCRAAAFPPPSPLKHWFINLLKFFVLILMLGLIDRELIRLLIAATIDDRGFSLPKWSRGAFCPKLLLKVSSWAMLASENSLKTFLLYVAIRRFVLSLAVTTDFNFSILINLWFVDLCDDLFMRVWANLADLVLIFLYVIDNRWFTFGAVIIQNSSFWMLQNRHDRPIYTHRIWALLFYSFSTLSFLQKCFFFQLFLGVQSVSIFISLSLQFSLQFFVARLSIVIIIFANLLM